MRTKLAKISEKSRILITGATGSFGTAFIKHVLKEFPNMERIVVYSRDELKQWNLQQKYPPEKYPNVVEVLFVGPEVSIGAHSPNSLRFSLLQLDL